LTLALLASVALLAGTGASHNLGEQGIAFVVSAEAQYRSLSAEATWDTSDKVETGDGWLLDAASDWHTGPLTLGAAYSRRETSQWAKDVWWARAGVQHGPLWLLASVAPTSKNMEAKAEFRLRCVYRRLVVEERVYVQWHTTAQELGSYAYGLTVLVGVTR